MGVSDGREPFGLLQGALPCVRQTYFDGWIRSLPSQADASERERIAYGGLQLLAYHGIRTCGHLCLRTVVAGAASNIESVGTVNDMGVNEGDER